MQVSVQILVLVDAIDFDRCYSKSILSWTILSLRLRSPKTPLLILLDHSFAIISYVAYQSVTPYSCYNVHCKMWCDKLHCSGLITLSVE